MKPDYPLSYHRDNGNGLERALVVPDDGAGAVMTEAQIKHMVDRFLAWRLPEHFNPDNGISFEPIAGKDGPYPFKREPTGTNLFDATQADAMVRHMIEGLP